MATVGSKPTTLEILALGRSPQLGQLYNARKSQFLTNLLYDEKEIKQYKAETAINHTDLSLTMANSFEDKAARLDISAELSVEILGGLISVSGSAEYLKDSKSNTEERSWAMALKMRLSEQRLLFAEEKLAGNISKFTKDYIAQMNPTHFVSSVVYGGNVIVNLVARNSSIIEKEEISGNLRLVLDKLKGAVDLDAKADVHVDADLEKLQDMFEFTLYGDVILETNPTTVEDVLKLLQQIRGLLGDGVPISVTLQPIPEELLTATKLIYNLEHKLIADIIRTFGYLDDINSRYEVLLESANGYKDSIPVLISRIKRAFTTFSTKHGELRDELAKFIRDFLESGPPPEEGSDYYSVIYSPFDQKEEKKSLTEKAEDLAKTQRQVKQSPSDPDTLAGLDHEYSEVEDFVTIVKSIGLQLNGLPEVLRAVISHPVLGLLLMPPLNKASSEQLLRFSSLARVGSAAYSREDPPVPTYVLYVETPATLEKNLPSGGQFVTLKEPSLFRGTKTPDGPLSWVSIEFKDVKTQVLTKLYDFSFDLSLRKIFALVERKLDRLDFMGPFTIATSGFCVNPNADLRFTRSYMSITSSGKTLFDFVLHEGCFDIWVMVNGKRYSMAQDKRKPLGSKDVHFSVAFVQDPKAKKWRFYFDGVQINDCTMSTESDMDKLFILVNMREQVLRWRGNMYDVQVYSNALTDKEIHNDYLALKRPDREDFHVLTDDGYLHETTTAVHAVV